MTESEIEQKINSYRLLFSIKLRPIINGVNFDSSKIHEIKVIPFNKKLGYFGKTNPIIKNGELYFEIIYTDIIFLWFSNLENRKYTYAKGVIEHELYHCKEMQITSEYIDYNKLYFSEPIDNTYKYVFNLSVREFSEYYAYLNSSKTYVESVDFEDTVEQSYIAMSALRDVSKELGSIQLIEEFKEIDDAFIDKCIIQIARYHATNNQEYIHVLDKYKDSSEYKNHYLYFLKLEEYLRIYFSEYPYNLNEEWLLSFGIELTSLYSYYNLKFENLSDNFVLKFIQ